MFFLSLNSSLQLSEPRTSLLSILTQGNLLEGIGRDDALKTLELKGVSGGHEVVVVDDLDETVEQKNNQYTVLYFVSPLGRHLVWSGGSVAYRGHMSTSSRSPPKFTG